MIRSAAGFGIFVLCLSVVTLSGCVQNSPSKSSPAKPTAVAFGSERATQLKQEIAKLQAEEQATQDIINMTLLEMRGPSLLKKGERDQVDQSEVGMHSEHMTAQYEYKSRISKKREVLEAELEAAEKQALGGGGGGGSGGGGGGGGSH